MKAVVQSMVSRSSAALALVLTMQGMAQVVASSCSDIASFPGGCAPGRVVGACYTSAAGVSWSCLAGVQSDAFCKSIPLPPPRSNQKYEGYCSFGVTTGKSGTSNNESTTPEPTDGPTGAPEPTDAPTAAPTAAPTMAPTVAPNSSFGGPAGSAVAQHGHLSVVGNRIVGEHGNPVRLRGMSLFWSQWSQNYWNPEVVEWLRDDWGITLLRAAMGVEAGGYLENPQQEKKKLKTVVEAAIEAGIYVVIDWHDHAATEHRDHSKAFFKEMAKTYGHLPNVLFETFNEPVNQRWSEEIKPYHEEVTDVIREHSKNIIICGTPFYSQNVDAAAQEKVAGENIAYTLHFYAGTHTQYLRDKAMAALENNVALFVSEWGTCEADGNGQLDFAETQRWLDFLEEHYISDACWAVNDKQEACSALQPGAGSGGHWNDGQLTESGRWVRNSLRQSAWPQPERRISVRGAADSGKFDMVMDRASGMSLTLAVVLPLLLFAK